MLTPVGASTSLLVTWMSNNKLGPGAGEGALIDKKRFMAASSASAHLRLLRTSKPVNLPSGAAHFRLNLARCTPRACCFKFLETRATAFP